MKFAPILTCLVVPLVGLSEAPASWAFQGEVPQSTPAVDAAPQTDGLAQAWPDLPDIGNTERMDQEVVALIQEYVGKVNAAQQGPRTPESEKAVGEACAQLGLAFEANTMWDPARDCYALAASLIPDEGSEQAQWVYRVGSCEHAMGDAQASMETLRAVAPKLTGTAVVHAKLARAYFDLGLLNEAAAAWEAAIASEPIAWAKADEATRPVGPIPLPASRVGLAQVKLEQDKLQEAKALLQEALSMQPGYPHAHYLLGLVLAEEGDSTAAELELMLGLNAFPVMPPDPHTERMNQLRAGYGNRMRNIEIAMQSGQIPQAIQGLEAMLEERKDEPLVLNLLARCHQMSGDPARGLQLLLRSETIDPTQHQTLMELTMAYFNAALQMQDSAQRMEAMNQARLKAEAAIRIAPHLGTPYYYRGLIEWSSTPQDDPNLQQILQQVLAYFQRAHTLGCKEPQLYEQMANLYMQTGRTREMVTYAEQGTKSNAKNPSAWIFLARAYLTVGRSDEALKAGDRALIVSNQDPQVQDFVNRLRQAVAQSQQK